MTPENRKQLADLIDHHKDEILEEWRRRTRPLLSARDMPKQQLNDALPGFLDELATKIRDIDTPHDWTEDLRIDTSLRDMAVEHGKQRYHIGFDIVEIVKEYGILREVLVDMAEEKGLIVAGKGGHAFMFVINKAVATAADAFQREKELEARQRRKEYFAFVMHDLKTPLNAIMVAAQAIEDAVDDPKLVAEMDRIILRSGEKLDELLQQTIKIEKTAIREEVDDLFPRTIELWPIVQSVIDEFRATTSVDKTSIYNLIPLATTIFADAVAIRSVFRNLVSNALKYAAGGRIVIGVVESHKGEIECWVRDNGSGMSDERLGSLFARIEPDPNQKGSTGLGLIMVRKIIEAHKGSVHAESKLGEGTTVRFTLPVMTK